MTRKNAHSSSAEPTAWRPARTASVPEYIAWIIGLAATYALIGGFALRHPLFPPVVSLLWLPGGLAVACLVHWGLRFWPGVWLGAFAVFATVIPWWAAFGVASGCTAGPYLAALLFRALQFRASFDGRHDVFLFAGVALIAMIVPAVNGPVWVAAAGRMDWAVLPEAVAGWWMGNTTGLLIAAPALLTLPRVLRGGAVSRIPITAVCLAGVAVLSGGVFFASRPVSYHLAFLPVLALTWAALYFRTWPTAVAVLVTGGMAVYGSLAGAGPLGDLPVFSRAAVTWAFVTLTTISTLLVSALLAEQETAASQFAEAARDYGALVEDTPALIVRFNSAGLVTFANQTICTFLGEPRDRVIGRPVERFVGKKEWADISAAMNGRESDTTHLAHEGPIRRHDGQMRTVRWTGRLLHFTDDGAREYQTVGIDLTDQRKSEEDKKSIETQLYHAQKLESLGVMAGGIAHDFNNLLTGIGGYADLASSELSASSPAQPHLDKVKSATTRAADLARQMLAYAGKATQTVRHVDLNRMIRESARLLESSVPKKCLIRLELSPDAPVVTADPAQLNQILMNLVINAGEAIGDRVGTISVWTGVEVHEWSEHGSTSFDAVLPPGRYAVLIVTDTGCGMSQETKRRIFDPFFTTKFTGRGLGLAAVLGIVRGHKGAIRCESLPNQGTKFRVLLPLAEAAANTPVDGVTALTRNRPVRAGTALVVDDEDTVRQLAGSMLEALGWRVVQASNGREAVRQFRGHADQFDLVLLDLTMPDMDGLETLAELRRIRAEVPVVLCSGYTDECISTYDLGAGPTPTFLPKPFRIDDLRCAVSAVAAV